MLEEPAVAIVSVVVVQDVAQLKRLHPLREIRVAELDEHMDVIRHEAERQKDPVELDDGLREDREITAVVVLIDEQGPPVYTSCPDVKDPAGELDSFLARHATKSRRRAIV